MTKADHNAFAEAFGRLAAAFHDKQPDILMLCAYCDALGDLEIEFLVGAVDRLLRTAAWFPKIAEWRREARIIESERRQAQQKLLRSLDEPLCALCADTGWIEAPPMREIRRVLIDKRVVDVPFEAAARQRCACAEARRLELLGRQPSPVLTKAFTLRIAGED